MKINPKVIDISHWDDVSDFKATYVSGIRGVFCKATQGTGNYDITYGHRRPLAAEAGLLWGAYHFNTAADVNAQLKHFIDYAQPDAKTRMALDLEDNPPNEGGTMTFGQAIQFLKGMYASDAIKTRPVLYSGNRMKELFTQADSATRAWLAMNVDLWLAQYGPAPKMVDANGEPLPWAQFFIWQYTGDGRGPTPHQVPGVWARDGLDINHYNGSDDELAAEWVG